MSGHVRPSLRPSFPHCWLLNQTGYTNSGANIHCTTSTTARFQVHLERNWIRLNVHQLFQNIGSLEISMSITTSHSDLFFMTWQSWFGSHMQTAVIAQNEWDHQNRKQIIISLRKKQHRNAGRSHHVFFKRVSFCYQISTTRAKAFNC